MPKSLLKFREVEREPRSANRATMKVIGTLKLPQNDATKFLAALKFYTEGSISTFLRQCAYALIKHYQKKDVLNVVDPHLVLNI
jgi:hypothetical protein